MSEEIKVQCPDFKNGSCKLPCDHFLKNIRAEGKDEKGATLYRGVCVTSGAPKSFPGLYAYDKWKDDPELNRRLKLVLLSTQAIVAIEDYFKDGSIGRAKSIGHAKDDVKANLSVALNPLTTEPEPHNTSEEAATQIALYETYRDEWKNLFAVLRKIVPEDGELLWESFKACFTKRVAPTDSLSAQQYALDTYSELFGKFRDAAIRTINAAITTVAKQTNPNCREMSPNAQLLVSLTGKGPLINGLEILSDQNATDALLKAIKRAIQQVREHTPNSAGLGDAALWQLEAVLKERIMVDGVYDEFGREVPRLQAEELRDKAQEIEDRKTAIHNSFTDYIDVAAQCAKDIQSNSYEKWASIRSDLEEQEELISLSFKPEVASRMCQLAREAASALWTDLKYYKPSVATPDVQTTKEALRTVIDEAELARTRDIKSAEANINANTDKRYRSLKAAWSTIREKIGNLLEAVKLAVQGKGKLTRETIGDAIDDKYANLERLSEKHREQYIAMIDYSFKHPITPGGSRSKASKYRSGLSFYKAACAVCQSHPNWKDDPEYYDAVHLGDACEKSFKAKYRHVAFNVAP